MTTTLTRNQHERMMGSARNNGDPMTTYRDPKVVGQLVERQHAVPCQTISCRRTTFRNNGLCDYHNKKETPRHTGRPEWMTGAHAVDPDTRQVSYHTTPSAKVDY